MQKLKILFLYTELASYFLSCVDELLRHGAEVHIVRWPVNKEAPFEFTFTDKLRVYERKEYARGQLIDLAEKISPDIIYCSGWIDKDYLEVCERFKKKIPVIVGFDNQWKGTLKQRIACLLAPFTIHRYFNYCWVPGELQHQFALKLGFRKEKILTGFYSADFPFFYNRYLANREQKQAHFPKRFIYAGRYYVFKGVQDLWKAFAELQQEQPNEWELWCLGTGDLPPYEHPKIRHFGFVQPSEMEHFTRETGVFILPSHIEPWGVVVHEFAASGFPLIVSSEVGARTAFLSNGQNGYIYQAGNVQELKAVLMKMMTLREAEFMTMGDKSVEMAKQITPSKWVSTLLALKDR